MNEHVPATNDQKVLVIRPVRPEDGPALYEWEAPNDFALFSLKMIAYSVSKFTISP